MISTLTAAQVLHNSRQSLGIAGTHDSRLDDVVLAALVRRSAGIHCPCSRATLRGSVVECTHGLSADHDSVPEAVDEAIEALIVGGDLLELNDVATDDADVRQTWVFAAPPSFVVRPNRSAFLLGIVPDQDTFLPSSFSARVLHRGFTRSLEPRPHEDLAHELRELGLQPLSDRAWLKSPRTERAEEMVKRHQRVLDAQPPVTTIPDLQILDPERPVTYYRGRWTLPSTQNGTFVARRPQEFGAPIWCLVCLRQGAPIRLLDLPLTRTRWRACDTAWHLQMAIDQGRGSAQCYRRRTDGDAVRLDFFSPLPQWSERRLMILGTPVPRDKCLISYVLPADDADTEEAFLQQSLWLSRSVQPG